MAMFAALLELADDHLILGHRISEWCGHAPMLEEDLALPNMGLDVIGTARTLYAHAAEIESKGRSEDDLAFLRLERDYRNLLLVERPNGDFAATMLRQLYFSAFMEPFWTAAIASPDVMIRGVAGKASKEMAYHVRHAGEWVIRLGDGTDESAARMQGAVAELHRFTGEMFLQSDAAAACGVLPDRAAMRDDWDRTIGMIFAEALLEVPDVAFPQTGGRQGVHGECLGHLLAEMQYLQRAYPGAKW